MLTQHETFQLINLLKKAAPRDEVAGTYQVIVTPTIVAPEDFVPRKKVCIGEVSNVVGELNMELAQDFTAFTGEGK